MSEVELGRADHHGARRQTPNLQATDDIQTLGRYHDVTQLRPASINLLPFLDNMPSRVVRKVSADMFRLRHEH